MSHSLDSSSHFIDGDETSKASSSSTPPPGQDYEVFLSFGGETRHGFTDHLYKSLNNVGVSVFRDKEGLPVGESNWPELVKAIDASKISIPIISPGYASSKWCLDELVQILECKKTLGRLVKPIFYHVKPSDVREQKRDFGMAFQQLLKEKPDLGSALIQEWKNKLMEVSYFTGWESEKIADRYEATLVDRVVEEVLQTLKKRTLFVNDYLVGTDENVKRIMDIITVDGSNNGRAILINGMGGIGKTTLAKIIYNKLCDHFKHCSYIANVHEASSQYKGMEGLQKQLISDILGEKLAHDISNVDEGVNILKCRLNRKKILLLLDDVDHKEQLNALVTKEWLEKGSIFIVTSRRKDILEEWKGSFNYELNELNLEQSLELFYQHAFKRRDSIPDEYGAIAKEIISTTGGLPLAIEIIGSVLYGKTKIIWEEHCKMLKEIPHDEVQKKLKISFEALLPEEQQIFLDIACLPLIDINRNRHAVFHMWESCGFHPQVRIEKLISMSLIKIEVKNYGNEREITIHDQLRDLGRAIVRENSINDPGKRSRLWSQKDAWEVIESKQGTAEVQTLDLYSDKKDCCTREQLEGMTNLRFLRMQGVLVEGDFGNLFQNLRWLQWYITYENTFSDFMGITFNFRKLVILELSSSNVTEHWNGWGQIKHLKVLCLLECRYLYTTPDFSAMEELEQLTLFNCSNLKKIHPSIGKLSKTLKVFRVSGCPELEELPIEMGKLEELMQLHIENTCIRKIPISEGYTTRLEMLSVRDCYNFDELPVEVGKMEELRHLDVCGTGIRKIPIAKGIITKLENLWADDCKGLTSISDSLDSLVKLDNLSLKGCASLTKIHESIGKLTLLTKLELSLTGVTQLPYAIGDLYNLEVLKMSETPIKCLPTSIEMLSKLEILNLEGCKELELLPQLPCSLTALIFHGDSMETLPDLSNLTNLILLIYHDLFERRNRVLKLGNLNQLSTLHILHSMVKFCIIPGSQLDEVLNTEEEINMASENIYLQLELPSSLEYLEIKQCQTLYTLPNLSSLKNLDTLYVHKCSELVEINGLEGAESLTYLRIEGCKKLSKLNGMGISVRILIIAALDALESLPHLSAVMKLKELHIFNCNKIIEIQGLTDAKGIQSVVIDSCSSLERIGDLSCLKMLTKLYLCNCKKLSDVQGIEKLTSLTSLRIAGINPKMKFPDLSMLKNLLGLVVNDKGIIEILGLQELKSLETLIIGFCTSLQYLPDLSQLTSLRRLAVYSSEKLSEIRGLENLPLLEELDIRGCPVQQNLPDRPNAEISSDLLEVEAEGEILPDSLECPTSAKPLEEDEEMGYLPDRSQLTNSDDIVGRSCFECPTHGCFPISQMLRSLLTSLKRQMKGQIQKI